MQTFRYLVCGGSNMAFDIFLYWLFYNYIICEDIVQLPFIAISSYIAAFMCVFPITFFTGFWLNKNIAFRYSPLRGHTQLLRYLLSVGGAILLNYALIKLFVEGLNIYPIWAKIMTTLVSVVYSYTMQKYFTFRGCTDDSSPCKPL